MFEVDKGFISRDSFVSYENGLKFRSLSDALVNIQLIDVSKKEYVSIMEVDEDDCNILINFFKDDLKFKLLFKVINQLELSDERLYYYHNDNDEMVECDGLKELVNELNNHRKHENVFISIIECYEDDTCDEIVIFEF